MYIKCDKIYFPNQIIKSGYLTIKDGKVGEVVKEIPNSEEYIDYTGYSIIPGFIDQHLHGWGTGSFGNDKSVHSINEMKKNLPYEGVTSFLATSGAEPIDDLVEGVKNASYVVDNQKDDGATLLGVHLEGPFINKEFKGMQREECCINPDMEIMKRFMNAQSHEHIIKLMTIAPELPGSLELIKFCKANNIQLNIGHSAATFDCIKELKEYGLGGVTHMFSGMKGFHHRELGVAGAAMYFDDLNCEFAKQTGMTVKPEAFEIIWKLKDKNKIIMTTDCGGMALAKRKNITISEKKHSFLMENTYSLEAMTERKEESKKIAILK